MEKMKLEEAIIILPKSKIKAGDGKKEGKYLLYRSSNKLDTYYNEYIIDTEVIIIGTGGNPSIHYNIGKCAYTTQCLAITSKGTLKNKYIYYYLLSQLDRIQNMFRGMTIKQLDKKEFFKIDIPIIEVDIQDKIIKNLDIITNNIQSKKEQLKKLEQLVKSQFVEMFGNGNYPQIRLQEVLNQNDNMEKVENTKIEKFITVGINGKGARERIIKDGKWPVPFVGYRVKGGQFIYSRIDARNGAFAIIPNSLNNAVVSKDFPIFDIDNNKIRTDILLYSLLEKSFIDIIKNSSFGATNRQRIKEGTFLNYKIYLPPIDLQNKFAEIVKQIDKQKFEIEKSLKETQELYESLMDEYFKGEKR